MYANPPAMRVSEEQNSPVPRYLHHARTHVPHPTHVPPPCRTNTQYKLQLCTGDVQQGMEGGAREPSTHMSGVRHEDGQVGLDHGISRLGAQLGLPRHVLGL